MNQLKLFSAAVLSLGISTSAMADLDLARDSGCLACHKVDEQVVGPAWNDVSERYSDSDRDQLIKKVKQGGKGNWTEVTGGAPMPPYSPRVSDDDIATLVDFILDLK